MMPLLMSPLFLLLFVASAGASGNRVGNGGNVVNCPIKVQMLDLYESKREIADFAPGTLHPEVIEQVLKNLEKANSSLAKQYRRRASEFLKETDMRKDVELTVVDDSKHLFSPADKNCKVQQIAIRKNVADSDSRFVVNKDLWDKLSERDKAALILHEVIYEHFFKLGEEDSVKARKINAYFFSKDIQTDKKDKFWQMVKELKLPIYQ